MDTNKNVGINEFSGGMNSDLNYNTLQHNLYVYGENIRLTSNALINQSENPDKKEGVVAPIPEGILIKSVPGQFEKILAIEQIDNICVVIVEKIRIDYNGKGIHYWSLYRITYNSDGIDILDIFTSSEDWGEEIPRFSTVINKEVNGIIKLYIADGKHEIMVINVNSEFDEYNRSVQSSGGEINFISNSYFPKNKIQIVSKLSGRLPVGQVLYTYRFYKKYGIKSKLAPLTNKIQIFDSTRNREFGNAEGTNTSVGLLLQIQYDPSCSEIFDRIQIFRVYYKKPNVDADIELIYDDKFASETQTKFNDIGQDALKEYSVEEFSMLDGQDIVPLAIEQNQGYMFAANVEDHTILNLSIKDFDARAYSVNSQGNVVLYRNIDSTYTDNPQTATINDVLNNPQFDLNEYTLNKYADMNVGNDVLDPCRYCVYLIGNLNIYYWGGTGKNVSWKFVKIKTPIHDIGNNKDAPVDIHSLYRPFTYIIEENYQGLIPAQDDSYTTQSYFIEHGILVDEEPVYNNMFTSSMLRSLRRDEVYRYGIILYDKHGNRTDVNWIADIRTPNANELPLTSKADGYLYAVSLGIQFDVHDLPEGIIGYLIVRCSKDIQYRKNIMQCIAARPIKQQMGEQIWSPYYPHYMLTSNPYEITNGDNNHHIYSHLTSSGSGNNPTIHNDWYDVYVLPNDTIFLLYSPEIVNRRLDSLRDISIADDIQFFGFFYYDSPTVLAANLKKTRTINNNSVIYQSFNKADLSAFNTSAFLMTNKDQLNFVYNYYDYLEITPVPAKIKLVLDVKNPLWENGFSNVKLGSVSKSADDVDDDSTETYTGITSATKQYKSFISSVSDKLYVNWVCNAMYDIKAFKSDINANLHEDGYALIVKGDRYDRTQIASEFGQLLSEDFPYAFEKYTWWRVIYDSGFIGPGPVCFIADIETNNHFGNETINLAITVTKTYTVDSVEDTYSPIGVLMTNIRHNAIQYAGLTNAEKQLDVYYGFGNFKNYSAQDNKLTVFDGDVYIVPFEIVLMFKTYDFNSQDTLQSAQFVYYVPIESKINTFLDYGINYTNSKSKTLLLEPGEITGVAMQDRPLSQYSTIMSDNSISNDIYNAVSSEKSPTEFNNRIHYSNQKISGEYMDSWLNFAPLNYIDVDSRYGDITCLKSLKNTLYCWQDISFGRISVNERSLVSDTNSNMILLGKGDVMQRIDYIDINHGMSANQYVCENVANRIYWIDDKNKVVMVSDGVNATNLSEHANVQSILNNKFNNTNLTIGYDSQSDELICKCLNGGNLLIFNTKLNLATSVYTRKYLESFRLNNNLYGIAKTNNNILLYWFGGIDINEVTPAGDIIGDVMTYMPSTIQFVVNDNSSITKVFDNQEIVFSDASNDISLFDQHSEFQFNTNISNQITVCEVSATSMEGNLRYSIPREQNAEYGNRMRGKWLKVSIALDGTIENAISHIITKFRQSF